GADGSGDVGAGVGHGCRSAGGSGATAGSSSRPFGAGVGRAVTYHVGASTTSTPGPALGPVAATAGRAGSGASGGSGSGAVAGAGDRAEAATGSGAATGLGAAAGAGRGAGAAAGWTGGMG